MMRRREVQDRGGVRWFDRWYAVSIVGFQAVLRAFAGAGAIHAGRWCRRRRKGVRRGKRRSELLCTKLGAQHLGARHLVTASRADIPAV